MTRRLFDFKCDNGHVTERFIDDSITTLSCASCGCYADRQISAPLIPIGVLGTYWATDRAKKQAKEKV